MSFREDKIDGTLHAEMLHQQNNSAYFMLLVSVIDFVKVLGFIPSDK